jgi:hypothetical protein
MGWNGASDSSAAADPARRGALWSLDRFFSEQEKGSELFSVNQKLLTPFLVHISLSPADD